VPVRTAEALASVLSDTNVKSNPKFVILSNPEFLAEGSAISDLTDPDRVLIGGPQNEEGQYAIGVLKKIYSHWIDESRIITANLWSSELSKLVANAFLAQRVSSINSIAMLCERTGADIAEVALAVGSDSRIGNKFLQASVGFGGSCFKKDIFNLVYLCEQLGLNHVAEYWLQVVTMNEVRKTSFVETIVTCMFNTVDAKILTIFGFAFKKNTCDTRESPAISVCQDLLNEGAVLRIYDPKVSSYAIERELGEKPFKCVDSPKQAVQDSHAIIILTEWDEFATLDYALLYERMQKPAFFFDGRNLNSLDHKQLAKIGFRVKAVGKPHF
jgi:UDPglucose 6-dehydrogenase